MACLNAQFVVVYGKSGQCAVFGHNVGSHDNRNLIGIGDLHQSGDGGSQGVIGRYIDEIHLACQGFRHLLDIVHAVYGPFLYGQVVLFAVILHHVGLDFTVDLAGGVNEAHRLGIGDQGPSQIHLGINGSQIADAGHVAAGLFIILHQFGRGIVRNGSAYDGNILDFIGYRLGCRSSNGADEFRLFRFETGCNGFQVGLVALGILLIKGDLILAIAPFL